MKTLYINPPDNPTTVHKTGNLIFEIFGIKNADVIEGCKVKFNKTIPTPNTTKPTIAPFIIPFDRNPPTKEEIIKE